MRTGSTVLDLLINGQSITTTPAHPFWSVDRQCWISARDLQIGERLRTSDGSAVPLEDATRCARNSSSFTTSKWKNTIPTSWAAEHWAACSCITGLEIAASRSRLQPRRRRIQTKYLTFLSLMGIAHMEGARRFKRKRPCEVLEWQCRCQSKLKPACKGTC